MRGVVAATVSLTLEQVSAHVFAGEYLQLGRGAGGRPHLSHHAVQQTTAASPAALHRWKGSHHAQRAHSIYPACTPPAAAQAEVQYGEALCSPEQLVAAVDGAGFEASGAAPLRSCLH